MVRVLLNTFCIAVAVFGLATTARVDEPALSELKWREVIANYEWITGQRFQGLPEDWSHHRLVFSQPTGGSTAARHPLDDPRYWQHRLRRAFNEADAELSNTQHILAAQRRNQGLWEYDLGAAGATVGTANFPAKYSFGTSAASCSDFVVYNTSQAGSATQPTILAFTNIYLGAGAGCGTTTAPTVAWAYSTGPGAVVTSPVLSLDGTKVAFVETSSGAHAILRVLKFATGAGNGSFNTGTQVWTAATPGSGNTATMSSVTFNGNPTDNNSSPFYDYHAVNDVLYVGDDSGKLHKFSPVFNGTPAEVTTGGWPVTVHTGAALTSPVYDFTSGNIFVGDNTAQASYVQASNGALGTPLALTGGGQIDDGPLVDSTSGKVFWFQTEPQTGGTWTVKHDVVQTSTTLTSSVRVNFNSGSANNRINVMHAGAFDYQYLSGAYGTGSLWVCSVEPGFTNHLALANIQFDSGGLMNNTVANSLEITNLSASQECSPVTEFYNSGNDRFFVGVTANGNASGGTCTGACIYSFVPTKTTLTRNNVSTTNNSSTISRGGTINRFLPFVGLAVTGPGIPLYTTLLSTSGVAGAWTATLSQNATATGTITLTGITGTTFPTAETAGHASAGGTSGIIVDNAAATTGASQTYFSTLSSQTCSPGSGGSGGCAIQATQALLN